MSPWQVPCGVCSGTAGGLQLQLGCRGRVTTARQLDCEEDMLHIMLDCSRYRIGQWLARQRRWMLCGFGGWSERLLCRCIRTWFRPGTGP